MKTINEDIDLFSSYSSANKAFKKTVSGHLLEAIVGRYRYYFIDRSKTAVDTWQDKYKLLKEK
jgi:hypothetical protein